MTKKPKKVDQKKAYLGHQSIWVVVVFIRQLVNGHHRPFQVRPLDFFIQVPRRYLSDVGQIMPAHFGSFSEEK